MDPFIRRTRTVQIGAGVYRVGTPTLRTVLLACELFGGEISRAWEAVKKVRTITGGQLDPDHLILLFIGRRPAELGEVLETFIAGPPVSARWPHGELLRQVVQLVDMPAIVESLQLDHAIEQRADPVEDDTWARTLTKLGERFGCAPHEILDWPYLVFSAVRDVLQDPEGKRQKWVDLDPETEQWFRDLGLDPTGTTGKA